MLPDGMEPHIHTVGARICTAGVPSHYVGTLVFVTHVLQVVCHHYILVCIIGSLVQHESFSALSAMQDRPEYGTRPLAYATRSRVSILKSGHSGHVEELIFRTRQVTNLTRRLVLPANST